jgi:hypothetical protein
MNKSVLPETYNRDTSAHKITAHIPPSHYLPGDRWRFRREAIKQFNVDARQARG